MAGLAVLLLGGAATAAWFGLRAAIDRPGALVASRAVVVPHGSAVQVAETLHQAGVIDSEWLFRLAAWLTRSSGALHAAELAFPARGSLRQVLAVLRTAPPVVHRLTIPEGVTAHRIATLLQDADAVTGPAETPSEGSVLPQTYDYTYGTPRAAILARATAAMDHALAAAWAERAPDLPLADARQASILASIVERETARPEERSRVAAVYLNRLRRGMRARGRPDRGLRHQRKRRRLRSPLDARRPGARRRLQYLPPHRPAARADLFSGLASILAVLHPAPGDDLYFVADGTGGHAFARTLEAHERNVAHWRALAVPTVPGQTHSD